MNVPTLNDTVIQAAAIEALRTYKQHRATYDQRDWEIERIYRAISKGKTVIAALDAIRRAGLDQKNRPRLAICQADAKECVCQYNNGHVMFGTRNEWQIPLNRIRVAWPEIGFGSPLLAQIPRIPPQHRPPADKLHNYHILWEANWTELPRDPYLLRRIGKDAWIVLAAWDLTEVELSVLRAHREPS